MKIIHTADLHIDSKMQSNLSKEKALERKKELIFAFERLVEFAKENKVEVIIIAGDMFDTQKVSIKTKDRVFNIIKENPQIDFLYLSGNHDEENFLMQLNSVCDNLKFFREDWTTFKYGNVAITGVINQSKNKLIYDLLNLNKDQVNIVAMHGQISKYNIKDNSEKVNLAKLKNKNIDYLALGHIHSFETGQLDDRGVYCYSGTLEGRGFDECGDKGFVLIDASNNCVDFEFVPFAKRTLHLLEYDVTGKSDWFKIEAEVIELALKLDKKDIVKVLLKGWYDLNLEKQIDHLNFKLNELFFFAKVKDESILEIKIEDFENDKTLKGEFIKEVLKSDLSDIEKEKIILIGLKALNGEDIG